MRVWLRAAYADLVQRSALCARLDLVLRSALLRASRRTGHTKNESHKSAFSRRMTSELFHRSTLIGNRGRREDRVPFAPMVRVQQKSTRQNHRYEPERPAFPGQWV